MSDAEPPYVILGCGYVGTRLCQLLRKDQVPVRVCGRRLALLEPLRALGAEPRYLDGSKNQRLAEAVADLHRPVVVYSIPGVTDLPPGEGVRRAARAALRAGASRFIYLGTSGVYGQNSGPSNDEWVDEQTPISLADLDMRGRVADEEAVGALAKEGLRTVILRLAAIYGPALAPHQPARGVRPRLRRGEYKLLFGGNFYFSRIYVDDLVAVIRGAARRAPEEAVYVVGDDEPCRQGDYGNWLAEHLGVAPPPVVAGGSGAAHKSLLRGKRLRNERMKRELGLTLQFPSYREGELDLDRHEAAPPFSLL